MKTPSNIVPCRLWHLLYLCENMRVDEIEQYMALSGAESFSPEVAAAGFYNTGGPMFSLIGKDGLPVVAGGYFQVVPGVWNSWMVGTKDGWANYWRSITKASRWMMDFMFQDMGARRLETSAITSRAEACWWFVKSLGMAEEGIRVGFGQKGEDVAIYGKLRPAEEVKDGRR